MIGLLGRMFQPDLQREMEDRSVPNDIERRVEAVVAKVDSLEARVTHLERHLPDGTTETSDRT